MQIIKIATYIVLILSLPKIVFATEDTSNIEKDDNLQSKDLITKLKEAKKQSQKQSSSPINSIKVDSSTGKYSQISTQAKDLQPKPNLSPLQTPPTRIFNLETANQLPKDSVQFEAGTHQATPADNRQGNTGYQNYYTSLDWGITDKLQVSFAAQFFDDPTKTQINGTFPNLTFVSFAPSVKYQVFKNEKFKVAVSGTAELLELSSDPGLFNNISPLG